VASRNFGQLDLLICAAGILHVHHHGLDVTRFQLGIRTNLLGPLYLIDSVLAKRLEQPSKPLTIVVLSSLLAGIAPPALAEYGISKLALNQAVRAFQEQYRESNVRFLLVQPGFIRTPFTNEFRFRPFSISTAQATSRIVDGIRSDRTYLSFPLAARGLAQIARRLPKISNQLIKRLLKPATKSPTTPESSPNNP
jgi:NAD(P)-dependent dehydrogenase (short-subunit alcohol dehydrogenase family)